MTRDQAELRTCTFTRNRRSSAF